MDLEDQWWHFQFSGKKDEICLQNVCLYYEKYSGTIIEMIGSKRINHILASYLQDANIDSLIYI